MNRKARGTITRLKNWQNYIAKHFSGALKYANSQDLTHYNFKVPVHYQVLEDNFEDISFRTEFIQSLLSAMKCAISLRNLNGANCLVTAIIELPNLFSSEICLFIDKDYWTNFTNREDDIQQWHDLSPDRDLLAEHNIHLESQVLQSGYWCEMLNKDYGDSGEIWIFSEREFEWQHQ